MQRLEVLHEIYEETMDLVFRLSDNYKMTIPKKGLEENWKRARERAEVLETLMEEME